MRSVADTAAGHGGSGTLAGVTVLQLVPLLSDERVGREALDVAVALLRSGARAMVAGGGGPLVGELQALGGEWLDFRLSDAGVWRRRRNRQTLRELIRTERIDLIHAYGVEAAHAGLGAGRSKLPLVVSYAGRPPLPTWGRRVSPQTRAGRVLTRSQFAAALVAERHGLAPERLRVVRSSVDMDVFDPGAVEPARVAALRRDWRVRPEQNLLLMPGRLAESRGHLTLIDAARILLNGGMRDVIFVIAGRRDGDEDFGAELDARIAAQGLGSLFRRVGHCADMPAAYAACDFVVLPMQQAPLFSMLAAEAQAMGRPVIASRIGAMPEHVVVPGADMPDVDVPDFDAPAGRTGWLTAPDDPVALARILAGALAVRPHERDAIGARARRFAERCFAREEVADATLAVYGELVDGQRAGGRADGPSGAIARPSEPA